MNIDKISEVLEGIDKQLSAVQYKGYDPYDFLNSPLTSSLPSNKLKYLGTQLLKRSPINVRPYLGIRKGHIPKGLSLILLAKCNLAQNGFNVNENTTEAHRLFDLLLSLRSDKYGQYCWGLNYPYATKTKYVEAYNPSLVVTSFVNQAMWEYFKLTDNKLVLEILESSADFVDNCLPKISTKYGESISYYIEEPDAVINANAHAAEMFARMYHITRKEEYLQKSFKSLQFVLNAQQKQGFWSYRILADGQERMQIDFHQGNILDSLFNCRQFLGDKVPKGLNEALEKGAEWYVENQFDKAGATFYRFPKFWPKDVHHQAQGIYTLAHISEGNSEWVNLSKCYANWAVENLRSNRGYFVYRKDKYFTNKTNFIRWGQAWMYLAFSELYIKLNELNS